MTVYLVVQWRPGATPETMLEMQGVFSTQEAAIAACKTDQYCIFPMELDKALPDEPMGINPECWFPLAQKETTMFAMQVTRTKELSDCTLGVLTINGQPECFTLEDVVREKPGVPVGTWKIPGETAIPTGTYDVRITFSPKFGRFMPEVLNVPGFEGIRIHPGNTDADTEGCILLGQSSTGGDFIGSSRAAFDAFFLKLHEALQQGELPTLTLTNDLPTDA